MNYPGRKKPIPRPAHHVATSQSDPTEWLSKNITDEEIWGWYLGSLEKEQTAPDNKQQEQATDL